MSQEGVAGEDTCACLRDVEGNENGGQTTFRCACRDDGQCDKLLYLIAEPAEATISDRRDVLSTKEPVPGMFTTIFSCPHTRSFMEKPSSISISRL